MPDDLTDAQRRYYTENRQGKPTAWLKGEEHGFPRGWYIIERTRLTGVLLLKYWGGARNGTLLPNASTCCYCCMLAC
jgi:hypothetical protein